MMYKLILSNRVWIESESLSFQFLRAATGGCPATLLSWAPYATHRRERRRGPEKTTGTTWGPAEEEGISAANISKTDEL